MIITFAMSFSRPNIPSLLLLLLPVFPKIVFQMHGLYNTFVIWSKIYRYRSEHRSLAPGETSKVLI